MYDWMPRTDRFGSSVAFLPASPKSTECWNEFNNIAQFRTY